MQGDAVLRRAGVTRAYFPGFGDRLSGARRGWPPCRSQRAILGLAATVEQTKNNFLAKMENSAMIEMLSAERSLVELAGLMRRGDGTGRKLQSVALTSLTEFPRRSIGAGPRAASQDGETATPAP